MYRIVCNYSEYNSAPKFILYGAMYERATTRLLANSTMTINGIPVPWDGRENSNFGRFDMNPGQSLTFQMSHPEFPSEVNITTSIPEPISNFTIIGNISQWIAKTIQSIGLSWESNNSCNKYMVTIECFNAERTFIGAKFLYFNDSSVVISNSELDDEEMPYPSYVSFSVEGLNDYNNPIYPNSKCLILGPESETITNLPEE